MPWERILILILVASVAGSANAHVDLDADAIADRYLTAMERKGYAFLSKEELARRHDQVAAFVGKHLSQPLDKSTRVALLDGIDRSIDRLYTSPAGKVYYGNGFGSGGEEWMYLNDRDYFLTFQYYLWIALTHRPLSPTDVQRRDTQRHWMRQYLVDLPYHEGRDGRLREGKDGEQVRSGALKSLENAFADPMHLLSEPMSDDGFAKLQDRFKPIFDSANSHVFHLAALTKSRAGLGTTLALPRA